MSASALFMSPDAFKEKDANPGTLTLNELRALHIVFNDEARAILRNALKGIFY